MFLSLYDNSTKMNSIILSNNNLHIILTEWLVKTCKIVYKTEHLLVWYFLMNIFNITTKIMWNNIFIIILAIYNIKFMSLYSIIFKLNIRSYAKSKMEVSTT